MAVCRLSFHTRPKNGFASAGLLEGDYYFLHTARFPVAFFLCLLSLPPALMDLCTGGTESFKRFGSAIL